MVDRLVQQAVLQILSPHYEPTFHGSSHGFRPGRSCHTAVAEAKGYVEEGYEWLVDLDLEKFFDRVHHDRLMARLGQRVQDGRLLQLIRRMLKAKVVMPDGVVVSTEEGAPQGGPLSPLLSNVVLDELDEELSRRGHRFVRYADDCNIYVRSERSGQRVMASVVRFIESRLRLKVNLAKSAVARPEERHFVGFRFRREPMTGDVEVLLSARSKDRIDGKIRELTPRTWGQSLRDCIQRINAYALGWMGFFWVCTGEMRTFQRSRRSYQTASSCSGAATLEDEAHDCPPTHPSRGETWHRVAQPLSGTSIPMGAESQSRRRSRTAQRILCRARTRIAGGPVEGTSGPSRRRPCTATAGAGMTAGGNTGTGLLGLSSWNASLPRRAGCEAHKSGSVRAGGGQPPPATRPWA